MTGDVGQACWRWWRKLTDVNSGRMRADLARLRRAEGSVAALGVAAVHDLHHGLRGAGHDLRREPDRLALIALALAQVRTSTRLPAARAMGQGDPPALSEIRFTTLIRAHEPEALITPLRRALRGFGQGADVARLATDLRWWSEATRARWCFEYYGAGAAAPEPDTTPEETEA
ncbi:type I-E CRISPR-associated protein Cse2/CasB [Palleronia caenipelagi]|uniref:Type I-E CRISPR-associated protein Cse2/CasB n=1 Tax=Palleronia caenipelagi TaxID=2489174 RepID=A0A547PMJ9_9RHOB|nr:type I-E CRISPR-associated protein Cse2/CasB [Palleronia caenipelagi]TRD15379.1 type I-E CRISPR-associated protein Cse2/CasB [Palleronia caenipelagi]